jgi:hypothetical protein
MHKTNEIKWATKMGSNYQSRKLYMTQVPNRRSPRHRTNLPRRNQLRNRRQSKKQEAQRKERRISNSLWKKLLAVQRKFPAGRRIRNPRRDRHGQIDRESTMYRCSTRVSFDRMRIIQLISRWEMVKCPALRFPCALRLIQSKLFCHAWRSIWGHQAHVIGSTRLSFNEENPTPH